MKNLKLFENYSKIDILCAKYRINNYSLNEDGSINVDGDVYLRYNHEKLNVIPIKFNRVNGSFGCNDNNLTTLENCPKYIGLHFYCDENKLTTLIDGPETVLGAYHCAGNNLKDVYGFPKFYEFFDRPTWFNDYYAETEPGYFPENEDQILFEDNPVYEIIKYCPYIKRIRFIKLLNEYKVIRNGNTIIHDRIDDVLYELGIMKYPEKWCLFFKNYELI